MDEPESAHDHKTLNALNEEIAAEQTRIADLQHRIRVIDVELAGWKQPAPPPTTGSANAIWLGWWGFASGLLATSIVGVIIKAWMGR